MIAEALAAACGDRAVLARLAGPIGEAARTAHDRLERAHDPSARRALRAEWAAAARAPVPPGIRGVHPSWIEAALAELPPRARADLAGGGLGPPAGSPAGSSSGPPAGPPSGARAGSPSGAPSGSSSGGSSGAPHGSSSGSPSDSHDPVAIWLVRWACAGLPPLPAVAPAGAGPPASIHAAVRLRGDDLATWLAEIGADQLAFAIGAAGRVAAEAIVGAARIVGDRLLRAASRIGAPPRAGALGPARAAIARCRVTLDDRALLLIGARSIAPHTDSLARRQLAVRLPRPIGLAVADALEAFARSPVEQAPTWRALADAY